MTLATSLEGRPPRIDSGVNRTFRDPMEKDQASVPCHHEAVVATVCLSLGPSGSSGGWLSSVKDCSGKAGSAPPVVAGCTILPRSVALAPR